MQQEFLLQCTFVTAAVHPSDRNARIYVMNKADYPAMYGALTNG
jgi:hypothetical protein